MPGSRFMKGYLARDSRTVRREQTNDKIAGVHVYVYTPKAGVAAKNKGAYLSICMVADSRAAGPVAPS